ncbi:MAG: class I mannose-6-phosphate isomerase, partial [Pirellulaceae bacterium]|nr:class I mannose-6-phosphate isomerase [Pirellulaceae bacterium]
MKPYPLRFEPVLKQTIWGGRRLGDALGKPIGDENNYAESWEIVDHGTDQSVVVSGHLSGKTLNELVARHRDWILGATNPGGAGVHAGKSSDDVAFPLLLKYLDCNRVLSVQVHPDDDYAASMPNPDLGKTEAWYIVAAEPKSLIYAGLKPGVDAGALREAVAAGQTENVLHSFHPDAGDVVFIPAGTVHALGAGLLVAEIQQSSNTTFRLFDWNRVGADGRARQLHIEPSIEVSDYESGPVTPQRSDPQASGWQELVRCEKFVLQALESGTAVAGGDDQFHILTVPKGTATIESSGE